MVISVPLSLPSIETGPRPPSHPGAGPPTPPRFWRGGGSGRPRWPRWRLLLLLLLLVAIVVSLIYLLARGFLAYPASVVGGLAIVAYGRSRRDARTAAPQGSVDPQRAWWAIVAGSAGFLATHLIGGPSVPLLLAGSFGIGGATGLFSWLAGDMVLPCLEALREVWREIRRKRWY